MNSLAEQEPNTLIEARRMLQVWAHWLQKSGHRGCRGYPGSVAFIFADEIRETSMPGTEPDNEEAERIERAMCVLKGLNRNVFKALVFEYVLQLTNREAAERLRVTVRTFKYWRQNGEFFIAGRINT